MSFSEEKKANIGQGTVVDRAGPKGPSASWSPTERIVADAWEKVLGARPESLEKNFFEAGGNSLLALRLIEEITKRSGRRIRLTDLSQRLPILRELAALVDPEKPSGSSGDVPSWLVPMRTSGTKPPFFFLGDFLDVGRYFKTDQPFYILMIGVDIRGEAKYRKTSFTELGAQAVAAIKSVQPKGPYYLAGYCFGGVLALEVTAQLQAQGERVAYLGFLEPPNTPRVPGPKRPAYFYAYLLWHKILHLPSALKHYRVMVQRNKDFAALKERLSFPNNDSFWDYTPVKLNIPIDFFFCRGSSARLVPKFDPRKGWQQLASTVYEEEVAGDHHVVLRAPHVADVAQAMERRLNLAQRAEGK